MSEPDNGSKRIKVVDRRPFDESGELRPDRPEPEKKPAAPPPKLDEPAREKTSAEAAASRSAAPEPSGQAGGGRATNPLFLDLVAGLAQQAEILMTGGQGLPAQPAEAQRVIEILAVLEAKTAGNLSTEEKQVLSNVIFQLRSLYVQHHA